MGLRQIGLDRNGSAQGAGRLVKTALLLQDDAEIGKQARICTVSRDSPLEQFGCRVLPARLMAEQSQQMQRVQVTGIDRQHTAIACFGFGQAPRPMMGKTSIKRLRRIHATYGMERCTRPTLSISHNTGPAFAQANCTGHSKKRPKCAARP
jgi:hypothetical protein